MFLGPFTSIVLGWNSSRMCPFSMKAQYWWCLGCMLRPRSARLLALCLGIYLIPFYRILFFSSFGSLCEGTFGSFYLFIFSFFRHMPPSPLGRGAGSVIPCAHCYVRKLTQHTWGNKSNYNMHPALSQCFNRRVPRPLLTRSLTGLLLSLSLQLNSLTFF